MSLFAFTKSDTVEDTLDELISRLSWITSRLDSKNVKRIDTNETVIKSADGTTYINGPVLEQSDSSGTLRLKQGYSSADSAFIFTLYNEAGTQTVGIDSNGDAVFTGAISASSITGGTISGTTITSGTFTGGTFTGGTFNGGIYKDENGHGGFDIVGHSTNYTDYKFYSDTYASGPKFEFYDELTGTILKSFDTAVMGIDSSGGSLLGDWDYKSREIVSTVTAGNGLSGGGYGDTVDLAIDTDVVVTSTSGQKIVLQYYGGKLEYSVDGGSFVALAND